MTTQSDHSIGQSMFEDGYFLLPRSIEMLKQILMNFFVNISVLSKCEYQRLLEKLDQGRFHE